ncbi:hypothetical protein JCM30471_28580 [Desulfuromonas carbonis]
MTRLLLFALFFYLGYRLLALVGRILFTRPAPPPAHTCEGEEMVRDPQCGTFLPRSDAVAAMVAGEDHYFCSSACREAYRGKG